MNPWRYLIINVGLLLLLTPAYGHLKQGPTLWCGIAGVNILALIGCRIWTLLCDIRQEPRP